MLGPVGGGKGWATAGLLDGLRGALIVAGPVWQGTGGDALSRGLALAHRPQGAVWVGEVPRRGLEGGVCASCEASVQPPAAEGRKPGLAAQWPISRLWFKLTEAKADSEWLQGPHHM